MVRGLQSNFVILWSGGIDRERVASSSEELVNFTYGEGNELW